MKVLLLDDVSKLGRQGDLVEVAPGFARNYLLPKGLAQIATKEIIHNVAARKKLLERVVSKQALTHGKLLEELDGRRFRISARVGPEMKLFGTVTPDDIADAVKMETGQEIDRRWINLSEPIRYVGDFEVEIKITADLRAKVTVEVLPEEAETPDKV